MKNCEGVAVGLGEHTQSLWRGRVARVRTDAVCSRCVSVPDGTRSPPSRRAENSKAALRAAQVKSYRRRWKRPRCQRSKRSTDWRTGNRQPSVSQERDGTWRLQIRYAPHQGARLAKQQWARSTDPGYDQKWATEAAAIGAKAHFKEWVDKGRNPLKRSAQSASAAARAEAVERARARPLLPTRFRGGIRLEAASVNARLQVGAKGSVSMTLGVAAHASEATLLQWHKRAAQVVDKRKRRRGAVEAAAAAVPLAVWADFHERCRKAAKRAKNLASASAASTSRARQQPRGRSRRQQVGQRRHYHSSAARSAA